MRSLESGNAKKVSCGRSGSVGWNVALGLALAVLLPTSTSALTIQVVQPDGTPIVQGFRWTLEEDPTVAIQPGVSCRGADPNDCLSAQFHKSYAPVIAAGDESNATFSVPDPTKRYFVSVVPDSGYANGGAPVAVGQATVKVLVQPMPLPTAQVRIFVFHDNLPTNGMMDLPEELGIEGFTIILSEGGGRYGMSGGQVTQDAFGNPLGTTYNGDGSVNTVGSGEIRTDADGYAFIQNLWPAKYSIQALPPPGNGWQQTSTIEGTKADDAWVKINEPAYFTEFGPPGPHVTIGFIQNFKDTAILNGGATIRAQVRRIHNARPPDFTFYSGAPFPFCWVALNQGAAGIGQSLYAAPCNEDSTFEITDVPPGDYGLTIWDQHLDAIIASQSVTVTTGPGGVPQNLDLLEIPIFSWFARYEGWVFGDDKIQNGFRDCVTETCDDPLLDEVGLSDVPTNLRFRDGTIYQSFPTDRSGYIPYDEVFPFFNWLIAEVDFTRLKATGATVIVDGGGAVEPDQGWDYPSRNIMTPQQQCVSGDPLTGDCVPDVNPITGNNYSRTEYDPVLPVLLEGMQTFLGQTNIIEWGKAPYGPGDNGGITGILQYATTRAENDPRLAVAEPWEPGIPRVQVNLYKDANRNGVIDDLGGAYGDADSVATLADIDNYPLGWGDGSGPKGPEDVDRNGNGDFDPGDAVNIAWADSWDDSQPTGCQGEPFLLNGVTSLDCYDGLRNFNQVRPAAVFDGGYAFFSTHPTGMNNGGSAEVTPMPAGVYIVEAVTPPGYQQAREEDRNVDFGIELTPTPALLPAPCVGDLHLVPNEFTMFPLLDDNSDNVPPFRAGEMTPLCDRKQVTVKQGTNAAANFFYFTFAPVAGHITGFILDDLSNEFDPNSPTFGEKYSPPYLPISIQDWAGREISRVYSDKWGSYNALVPSTYSVNAPMPSGVSPSMMITCMNSPGPIPNPSYDPAIPGSPKFITDPYFNRQYSQFCYTFQYMPGTTTYLDTPVMRIAAFAGPDQFPLDCEYSDGTPVIFSVTGPAGFNGPYVPAPTAGNPRRITIVSAGTVPVPNPSFDPSLPGSTATVPRDFGFGATQGTGTVYIRSINPTSGAAVENSLTGITWTNGTIAGNITTSTLATGATYGQVMVRRSNGKVTPTGVTVTAGGPGNVIRVQPSATGWPDTPIQNAIEAAAPGDLILVAPGLYDELVVMWKPVRLQGWGAASTVINAARIPGEKIQAWRDKIQALIAAGSIDLLPSQEIGFALPEPTTLFTEEGPGILVIARDATTLAGGGFVQARPARIDGLSITGADQGGGIFVNAYARYLEISNNRVYSNNGIYGGGIRVGHPYLTVQNGDALEYDNGQNTNIKIRYNQVIANGATGGADSAGGGITLSHGSNDYEVSRNFVCGNFSNGSGGGISHFGLSPGGLIFANTVLFNENFNQGQTVSGGGIFVGSAPTLGGVGTLPPGSGTVTIDANLIQGNNAGAGDGGGIRAAFVSGQEVAANVLSSNVRLLWYALTIRNNMIVDNVAALAGGGISLQDVPRINILFNTIANNDSTGTAGEAFPPNSPNLSTSQPAGIVSRAHTAALAAAIGPLAQASFGHFSNPENTLIGNIIRHNRSFHFEIDPTEDPPAYGLVPRIPAQPPVYWDLAVLGYAGNLKPRYTLLTEGATVGQFPGLPAAQFLAPPAAGALLFVNEYFNGDRGQTILNPDLATAIPVVPAFDEGGNFISVRFGPLSPINPLTGLPFGNYHLRSGSLGINRMSVLNVAAQLLIGGIVGVPSDYDGQNRPNPPGPAANNLDTGADEFVAPGLAAPRPSIAPIVTTSLTEGLTPVAAPSPAADTQPPPKTSRKGGKERKP